MLAIKDTAISNTTPGLDTSFVIGVVQLIADNGLRVWFTGKPTAAANTTSNYIITGPKTVSVTLAQTVYNQSTAIDVYFNTTLSTGQWTLAVSSNIHQNDAVSTPLPANTKVIFDVIEVQSAELLDQAETALQAALPRNIKTKANWSILIDAIQDGDDKLGESSREAYKQIMLNTATGSYLIKRAADQGVNNPSKVGLNDDDFRQLAITVKNDKLTTGGFLDLLEVLFGYDSVHAYIETQLVGPYRVFDGADLTVLVDGKKLKTIKIHWNDYQNPLQATVDELVAALNVDLEILGAGAVAKAVNGKARIYSLRKGIQSTIQVVGGTLQAFTVFNSHVSNYVNTINYLGAPTWTISVPSIGVSRFTVNNTNATLPINFTDIQIGDYVVIIGSEFASNLRGSFPITNLNYTISGGIASKWFEIATGITSGSPSDTLQSYGYDLSFFRPVVKRIFDNSLWASVSQVNGVSSVSIPATSQAVQRTDTKAAYLHTPQQFYIGP